MQSHNRIQLSNESKLTSATHDSREEPYAKIKSKSNQAGLGEWFSGKALSYHD